MLGTIVEKLKKDKNTHIIIASGDMDTMQLVDDKKVRENRLALLTTLRNLFTRVADISLLP